MSRRWLAVILRVGAAGLAVWTFRYLVRWVDPTPSVWLTGLLSFALAKLAGDAVALTLFRDTVVLFVEDLVWELLAFLCLGALAAGLILLTSRVIGGPVEPYLPAVTVYLVYIIAEGRQRGGTFGGERR